MSIGEGAERIYCKDEYLTHSSAKGWVGCMRYKEWAREECASIEEYCAEFMRLSQIILVCQIDPMRLALKITNFARFCKM
jgi:hypothetical protein